MDRTPTTRTPCGPRSTASDLVRDSTAPKAAPMADVPGAMPRDGGVERQTRTPDPGRAICRAAERAVTNSGLPARVATLRAQVGVPARGRRPREPNHRAAFRG